MILYALLLLWFLSHIIGNLFVIGERGDSLEEVLSSRQKLYVSLVSKNFSMTEQLYNIDLVFSYFDFLYILIDKANKHYLKKKRTILFFRDLQSSYSLLRNSPFLRHLTSFRINLFLYPFLSILLSFYGL